MTFKAKINDQTVYINVTDLDAFFHAGPNDNVFVQESDDDGSGQYMICKRELTDLSIEE